MMLKVTALEDDSGVITAFVNDMPGLVVQGKSDTDVRQNLDAVIAAFIKKLDASRQNLDIVTKSL